MKDKRKPLIRIFETLDKDVYCVEIDTLKITKNQGYALMNTLYRIYKTDQRESVIRGEQNGNNWGYDYKT